VFNNDVTELRESLAKALGTDHSVHESCADFAVCQFRFVLCHLVLCIYNFISFQLKLTYDTDPVFQQRANDVVVFPCEFLHDVRLAHYIKCIFWVHVVTQGLTGLHHG